MTNRVEDREAAGSRWKVLVTRGLWPLPVAAAWAWLHEDVTPALWWVGLFVLLQFVAAANYLARPGGAGARIGG